MKEYPLISLSSPRLRAIKRIYVLLLLILHPTFTLSWSAKSFSIPYHGQSQEQKKQQLTRCQMAAGVSGVESTPNPSSFLIRLSTPLVGLEDMAGSLKGKTFSFPSNADAPKEVASILEIDGIKSVYAMATVLTINKKSSSKWENILPLVIKSLLGSDESGAEAQEKLLQGLMLAATATTMSSADTSTTKAVGQQVLMRMQISNKIPIQIEGTGSFGTVQRMKLAPKFQEHMELMQSGGIDFFAGRQWIDRGIRYLPEDDEDSDGATDTKISNGMSSIEDQERLDLQLILQAEVEEVDAAYPSQRLARIVSTSLGENHQRESEETTMVVIPGEEEEEITSPQLDLEAVDRYCDLAEVGDLQALRVLVRFVMSHKGLLPARRNAIAYLGGTADNAGTMSNLVFDAVASALKNEKNPTMRRTAGDAMSDLGNKLAVPYAASALEVDRSKLVQWRAARILGELADSTEMVAVLKQASFSSQYAFDVAFEIKDALRKVQARVKSKNGIDNAVSPNTGPIWKQIQEGASSTAIDGDTQ